MEATTYSSPRLKLPAGSFLRVAVFTVVLFTQGIICNIFLILGSATRIFNAEVDWTLKSWTASWLWTSMQKTFERRNHGAKCLTFSGDRLPKEGESAIVIANHQSYVDFLAIQALAIRCGYIGYNRYFVKKELVWQLPIFGISFWLIGMILVDRRWTEDRKKIEQAFSHLKRSSVPIWIISYLEGHRKTEKGIKASQAYCTKSGKTKLLEVLYPRTKGFVATVNGLRDSHVKVVYDITVAYTGPKGFGHPPNLLDVYSYENVSSLGWKIHIHTRRILIEELPKSDEELAAWAEEAFVLKDQILQQMRLSWISGNESKKLLNEVWREDYFTTSDKLKEG